MTEEEFSQAIETLMNNEETRAALLEKLMEVAPGQRRGRDSAPVPHQP